MANKDVKGCDLSSLLVYHTLVWQGGCRRKVITITFAWCLGHLLSSSHQSEIQGLCAGGREGRFVIRRTELTNVH